MVFVRNIYLETKVLVLEKDDIVGVSLYTDLKSNIQVIEKLQCGINWLKMCSTN